MNTNPNKLANVAYSMSRSLPRAPRTGIMAKYDGVDSRYYNERASAWAQRVEKRCRWDVGKDRRKRRPVRLERHIVTERAQLVIPAVRHLIGGTKTKTLRRFNSSMTGVKSG